MCLAACPVRSHTHATMRYHYEQRLEFDCVNKTVVSFVRRAVISKTTFDIVTPRSASRSGLCSTWEVSGSFFFFCFFQLWQPFPRFPDSHFGNAIPDYRFPCVSLYIYTFFTYCIACYCKEDAHHARMTPFPVSDCAATVLSVQLSH